LSEDLSDHFETARARTRTWIGNDPIWRLGRSFPGGDRIQSHNAPTLLKAGSRADSRLSNGRKAVPSESQEHASKKPKIRKGKKSH